MSDELTQLQQMADEDDNIYLFCSVVCQGRNVRNLRELFELDPDALFELHDEMCSMVKQLPKGEL